MILEWLRAPNAEQWDALVQGSPGGGHFLQSFAWGRMKRRFGWRPFFFALRDTDGTLHGTALVLAYRTPLGKDLLYCPKGPWIDWRRQEAVTALVRGLRRWGQRHNAFALRLEPHLRADDAEARRLLAANGVAPARWEMQYKTGWVVDLAGTESQVLEGMKAKTRYNIRLAERKGVTVRHDSSRAALANFHAMYAATAARDGFAPRPAEYLVASCLAMMRAGHGTLIWAEVQGKPVAAIAVYAFGRKAWYWLGASSSEERQLMPTYLVQWEGMRWARAHGAERYDMTGVPSPDHLTEDDPFWGLYRFKSGFGGEAEDLIGTCEFPIDPLMTRLWHHAEPAYYRLYQRLYGDVYY